MTDDAVLDETRQPARRKLLQVLGPGLITGASDDDPSGIATYSQVGAQFGYGLAWTLVFQLPADGGDPGDQRADRARHRLRHRRQSAPALSGVAVGRHRPAAAVLQSDQSGRRSRCDGRGAKAADRRPRPGLCRVVRRALGRVADLTRYARYVSILKWGCLSLLGYVICAFVVHVAWGEVAWAVVWPPLSFKPEDLMAIVAVMGTTISPYLFFWQAGQEVEDTKEGAGARPLTRAPEQAQGEFTRIRDRYYIGMAISTLVAFFIVITTAATLKKTRMA
jgi:Mn2+/Fe2+ NRAMP family transporter